MSNGEGGPPPSGRDPGPSCREACALLGLLAIAGALRALAWSRTVVLFNDGPIFLEMARAIEAGRWDAVLGHPFHPLYPAAIAAFAGGPIDLETAAIIVSVCGGILAVAGIFFFVRRLFGRVLAWPAAWIVALHPWAVDFSSDVMSDGLYTGLYLAGLAGVAYFVDRPRATLGLFVGVAIGLAYLARPEGLGLVFVLGGLLALKLYVERGEARPLLVGSLLAVLAATLVATPYLAARAERTGEWRLSPKKSLSGLIAGRADVVVTPPTPTPTPTPTTAPTPDSRAADAAGATVRPRAIPLPRSASRVDTVVDSRPERSVLGLLEAIYRVVSTSLAALRYEVAACVVLGLWAIRRDRVPVREAAVLLPAFLYTGLLVLLVWGAGYLARRHALAALLPLCVYAAIGWFHGLRRLASARSGNASAPSGREALRDPPRWIAIALVVVLCLVWGARDLRVRRADRLAVRSAAQWLATHAEGRSPVAAQKLRVAYYAEAPFVPLPSGRDGRLEVHLRRLGTRWIVIDRDGLEDHRGLSAGVGDWLRLVHREQAGEREAWILEVMPEPAI